jgi:hypothetical protein
MQAFNVVVKAKRIGHWDRPAASRFIADMRATISNGDPDAPDLYEYGLNSASCLCQRLLLADAEEICIEGQNMRSTLSRRDGLVQEEEKAGAGSESGIVQNENAFPK